MEVVAAPQRVVVASDPANSVLEKLMMVAGNGQRSGRSVGCRLADAAPVAAVAVLGR